MLVFYIDPQPIYLSLLLLLIHLYQYEVVDDVLADRDDAFGIIVLLGLQHAQEFDKDLPLYLWRCGLIEIVLEVLPDKMEVEGGP